MHASASISFLTFGAYKAMNLNHFVAGLASFSTAMLVGHIKESTDPFYDPEDMEANAIGAGVALIVPMTFWF